MFVRISDRGEPAKINFCRLRSDSIENSFDPCSGSSPRDRTFVENCIALSMNLSFLALLDSASRVLVHDGRNCRRREARQSYAVSAASEGTSIGCRFHRVGFKPHQTTLSRNGPKALLFRGVGEGLERRFAFWFSGQIILEIARDRNANDGGRLARRVRTLPNQPA